MSIVAPQLTEQQLIQLGEPISGPSAFSGDARHFWHLTYNIAKTQWKLRFFGSVLGYLWQLMRPLLLFGVLLVFWTQVAHIGNAVPGPQGKYYAVQLLGGIVLFTFFQEATGGSVRAVVDNETLVRKIHFPRLAIPLSMVLVALFNLGLNLIVVFIFALALGVTPMWSWFELPLVVLILAVLATGCATLLSSTFVYFRDVQPIWEVVCQVLFYASPILVPMAIVSKHIHGTLLKLYMMNPLSVALEQFKHAVVNHAVPSAAGYGGALVLIPLGGVLLLCIAGFVVFSRMAPYVAENI